MAISAAFIPCSYLKHFSWFTPTVAAHGKRSMLVASSTAGTVVGQVEVAGGRMQPQSAWLFDGFWQT